MVQKKQPNQLSNDQQIADFIPEDRYLPMVMDACKVLFNHPEPHDLLKALFTDKELQWVKDHLNT